MYSTMEHNWDVTAQLQRLLLHTTILQPTLDAVIDLDQECAFVRTFLEVRTSVFDLLRTYRPSWVTR